MCTWWNFGQVNECRTLVQSHENFIVYNKSQILIKNIHNHESASNIRTTKIINFNWLIWSPRLSIHISQLIKSQNIPSYLSEAQEFSFQFF